MAVFGGSRFARPSTRVRMPLVVKISHDQSRAKAWLPSSAAIEQGGEKGKRSADCPVKVNQEISEQERAQIAEVIRAVRFAGNFAWGGLSSPHVRIKPAFQKA